MTDLHDRRLPGGLLLVGEDGTILEAPRFLRDALEFASGDGATVFELFSTKRTPRLAINRVVAQPDGEREYHVSLVREHGQPRGFRYWDVTSESSVPIAFFIVDDSSVIKSYEWRLKRLRRGILNDAQSFAAKELRDRIGTLTSLAEVMRDQADLAAEAAPKFLESLDSLNEAVRALEVGLSKEGDSSIPVRLQDVPTILTSWSDKMVQVVCDTQNVFDPSEAVVAGALEHVLGPLVENAIEARPKDAKVKINIQLLGQDKVCFEVVDKGRGMTKHELARAEDPFFTSKRAHAGVGLSDAKEVLRSLGGYWNISSSRRRGTRVRVVLPIVRD